MKSHDLETRVSYAETDRMGVVYYGNYLSLFERGRTEFLRALGVRYRDLETEKNIFLPVVEAACRYLAPGRYDDRLRVRTFIAEVGGAQVTFRYEVTNAETRQLLVTGTTRHVMVNAQWKPARFPKDLGDLLRSAQE